MRPLVHPLTRWKTQYKKLFRSSLLVGLLLVSAMALVACGAAATPAPTTSPTQPPTTTPTEQPTPTPQLVEEPAPVESVSIEVTGTDPVTAELVLVTGLPNGCYSFQGHTLERDGDTFNVTATNVRPDQEDLVCTMIYGTETTRIQLSGDIEVCETYTVVVNGESFSARAEGPAVTCEAQTPMKEEPAPVESVSIEVTGTDPVTAELVLVTGLPGGCYSFQGYTLDREGDTFNVTATNVRPDQDDLACTLIYGMETTRIQLTGDIEACKTYTVVVNGESFSVRAEGPAVTCEAQTPMKEEPAPVESVTIEAEATDPVQANLVVVSGLPNACYAFGRYNISREGDSFQVEIVNLVPDDPNLACAEIYRMVTTEVPLDGEIEVCKTYTVVINGESHSVQAIAPNVRCADASGTEVTLGMGETVSVGDEGLAVTFLDVTEDSRCPSDVTCVQAGQATVTMKVEMDGSELGTLSLSLGPAVDMAPEPLGGYSFQLSRLDPYPVSTMQIQPEDYVAYVYVQETEDQSMDSGY